MRENDGSSLLHSLEELRDSDMLPLHMPGHKRRNCNGHMSEVYGIDITEIDDFDDLHDPDGIIKDMEERFARLYGAGRVYLSVNGSTSCNEAAILSVCRRGDEIIIPRASHKSVYHAIEIGGLRPVYIRPPKPLLTGVIPPPSPDEVKQALKEHPEASCVVITSPTYEGLIADVCGIARIVHEHGGVLIVDSAHGAHIGIERTGADQDHSGPLAQGADICVVSLHKMLPAPTQTALILVGKGLNARITSRLRHYLDVFVSSSPSYVLMAGAGECLDYAERCLDRDLDRSGRLLERFRTDCSVFKSLDVSMIGENADPFKIVIRGKGAKISGQALYGILRTTHHIQCEMYGKEYVLALMSVMDDESSFDRLYQALKCEDDILCTLKCEEYNLGEEAGQGDSFVDADEKPDTEPDDIGDDSQLSEDMFTYIPERYTDPGEAVNSDNMQIIPGEKAHGLVAGSYVCIYPPGIPIIIPGEIIDKRVTDIVRRGLEKGLKMTGIANGQIPVIGRRENE